MDVTIAIHIWQLWTLWIDTNHDNSGYYVQNIYECT